MTEASSRDEMPIKRTEIKTMSYEEAVKLVRHSPFERERRDLIVFWGSDVPSWHWSRRTDLTMEEAIAYHQSLNEAVMRVDGKGRASNGGGLKMGFR